MAKLNVLVKRPGESLEEVAMDVTLKSLQEAVRGPSQRQCYVELLRFPNGVHAYVNDNGKALGLEPNFPLPGGDLVVGTAVFLASDDEGEEASLSAEQKETVREWLGVA